MWVRDSNSDPHAWQACCQLSHFHSPKKLFDASVLLLEINASLSCTLTHWEFAVLTLLLTWGGRGGEGGFAFEKWSSIPSLFEEDEDHRHVCVLVFQNVMHYCYNKH